MKKIFSTRASESALSFAMLILRLGTGSLMLMNHGLDKLIHFSEKAGRFAGFHSLLASHSRQRDDGTIQTGGGT